MTHAQDFAAWSSLPSWVDLGGWRFVPYEQAGEVRAIAALQGTEIHFAVAPQHRHRTIARQRTRDFLAPLLDDMGFLTTRQPIGAGAHRFLTRLGFAHTQRSEHFDHYMLAALPWAKEH